MEDSFDIEIYRSERGKLPYEKWLVELDKTARAHVRARINRLRLGNFGDCKPLKGGICELRIHKGPGYRIYYGIAGNKLVLLLCGGDKSTQSHDIEKAISYWKDYQSARQKED